MAGSALAPALPTGADRGCAPALEQRGFLLLRWPGTKLEVTTAARGRRDGFRVLDGEVI